LSRQKSSLGKLNLNTTHPEFFGVCFIFINTRPEIFSRFYVRGAKRITLAFSILILPLANGEDYYENNKPTAVIPAKAGIQTLISSPLAGFILLALGQQVQVMDSS
jgi:hypothetical protein